MTPSGPAFIAKHPIVCLIVFFLALLFFVGLFQTRKPLPAGLSFNGPLRPVHEIRFYRDLTWLAPDGTRQTDHEIFDQMLTMIQNARHFILIDMFFFNDFKGAVTAINRPVSSEIIDALIAQKNSFPGIHINVITDPINTIYGGLVNSGFERLKAHGISVTFTRLEALRDSNPFYSSFWRFFIQPFGNGNGQLLPNPFGSGRVSVRSYLKMFNFKANHRKVIITDNADDYLAMVSSANLHDASSFHSNAAIVFSGPAVKDLVASDRAVLNFSGGPMPPEIDLPDKDVAADIQLKIVTERQIKKEVLTALSNLNHGDRACLVMFYLSDRMIMQALQSAYLRGAELKILLDPNKDAFGYTKNGIPNRQTGAELAKNKIPVRWSDTHGEQAHAKMLLVEYAGGHSILITGSANYTRRNLDDYNLETDVAVYGPATAAVFNQARAHCDLLWENSDHQRFSVGFEKYEDHSKLRYILYRWMEATGMCTF